MSDVFPGAKLMQVVEWGYPKGSLRPIPSASKAYSTIHITANLATAENEAAWRIRDAGLQNSATFFVNRDGSIVQLLGDPARMDPWANGDVKNPDVTNPRIAQMVRDGVNANERTLVAIENVGNEIAWGSVPGGHPITAAQEEAGARILAHYHPRAGVPISRETVIGHYQLNSVSRVNCPSRDKRVIDRIVARARAIATQEDDMSLTDWRPVEEDWTTGVGPGVSTSASGAAKGEFWTAGPEQGDRKSFTTPTAFHTFAESKDGTWRIGVAAGIAEVLCIHRLNLRNPRNRRPSAPAYGYQAPPSVGDLEAKVADQADTIGRLSKRITAKDAHIGAYPKG